MGQGGRGPQGERWPLSQPLTPPRRLPSPSLSLSATRTVAAFIAALTALLLLVFAALGDDAPSTSPPITDARGVRVQGRGGVWLCCASAARWRGELLRPVANETSQPTAPQPYGPHNSSQRALEGPVISKPPTSAASSDGIGTNALSNSDWASPNRRGTNALPNSDWASPNRRGTNALLNSDFTAALATVVSLFICKVHEAIRTS